MKQSIFALAVAVGCGAGFLPAQNTALTSLPAIHALTNAQAAAHPPVDFSATVTYSRSRERTLFVQDGETAVFVLGTTGLKLMPGDRVHVQGTMGESFRPIVHASVIERLGHGQLPNAVPATWDDLIRARYDCRQVTVRGIVRSANVQNAAAGYSVMQMAADGGNIDVTVDTTNIALLDKLVDAEVEVTGAASGRFDGKMQQTGVLLHVPSAEKIRVTRAAAANPWSLPVTPMDEIITGYHVNNLTGRVRVHGTIMYYQPGSAVVLQDGSKSLWIRTKGRSDLRVGDVADATGIPDVHDGFLTLVQAEVRESGIHNPIAPRESTWSELTQSGHIFDLVSMRGTVVAGVREGAQDEYVLLADGHLFSAIVRHPAATYSSTAAPSLPPMKQIPAGATVLVTGICIQEDSNPFDQNVPFNLMMRSYDDIAVIAWPSWMTVSNLVRVISAMVVVMLGIGAWGWTLRRKVRHQTTVLAARAAAEADAERRNALLQQQRSRILEDINGSRPLVEVLEQITELVSFQLKGAPCWCEIADGARLGRFAADVEGRRIVREPIAGRSGSVLGTICAAVDIDGQALAHEGETFFVGSQLAALAIENRRLYSDLVHRSEFDLLTDIHNRFSLDKHLEAAIARARENAGVFGLIFVDLDEFKLVNDGHGHRIGDLYLQEVSARMKRQLRGADLLARVGGDEFAVLVPTVHNRADVEEIAFRLEHSFAAPINIDGHVLRGSASIGIALYPEDGSTKDSLMSAADSAMYVHKNMKRSGVEDAAAHPALPGR